MKTSKSLLPENILNTLGVSTKRDISIVPTNNADAYEYYLKAKYKYDISMKNSWMIGDSESDIKAANAAGIFNTVLVRSGHLVDESNSNSKFTIDSIKHSKQLIID